MEALSARLTRTESDLIREGVDQVLQSHRPASRKPRPLLAFNDPVLDDPDRIEEALQGFGED